MTPLRHRVAAATATSVPVAAIAAGCSSATGDDGIAPEAPSSTTPATTTTRPSAGSSRYRDGDYEAKGWFCASAVNRRAWGDGLHHILDARTGTPVRDVLATWVIADNATLADGIATALFLTDPPRLNKTYRFTFVRMSANGIEASPGFDGELFV
jgi:ApbE family protein